MEDFFKLGFLSMTDKVTKVLEKPFPFIVTGALIAAIWIYFLFLVPRKGKRYDRFLDYLNDVLNYRVMLSCVVTKILYIAFAIIIFIVGLVAIFAANFFVGLIGMLILELILRLIFEFITVLFSIHENLVTFNNRFEKLDNED